MQPESKIELNNKMHKPILMVLGYLNNFAGVRCRNFDVGARKRVVDELTIKLNSCNYVNQAHTRFY